MRCSNQKTCKGTYHDNCMEYFNCIKPSVVNYYSLSSVFSKDLASIVITFSMASQLAPT